MRVPCRTYAIPFSAITVAGLGYFVLRGDFWVVVATSFAGAASYWLASIASRNQGDPSTSPEQTRDNP